MSQFAYSPFRVPTESLPSTSYSRGLKEGLYQSWQLKKEFPPTEITLKELISRFAYFQQVITVLEKKLHKSKSAFNQRRMNEKLSDAIDSAGCGFRALIGIDKAREYCALKYGCELSQETTERMIFDLIKSGRTRAQAEELTLENSVTILQSSFTESAPLNFSSPSNRIPSNVTQHVEGIIPPDNPFIPLTSWSEILAALNEQHGEAYWKNDPQTHDKIRKLNSEHNGPIKFPQGKGKQPSVSKSVLLTWWNGMQEDFDTRNDMKKAEAVSARLTVADSHNYGKTGKVVPGINGSEKNTRKYNVEKGEKGKK